MTETNGGSPPPQQQQQQPRRQPPPMLSLPQKQNQNQTASSFENIFNTGGAASGFSPGPMTLVSNYFSDHFSDGSFSQLLAGAMNSPVSSQINPSLDNSNKTSFKDKKPMDLVIAQSPTGFMFPNLFSPSGLLNSPGFFSPLQSPLVSHQQALAHVTAQAALSQAYFNNVQPENYNGGLGTVANEEETRMVNANVELEDSQIGSPDELSVSQSDVSESQHVVSGSSDINDGYNWRKYGQKQVKASEHPRSYYKCTHPNCPVKKKVGQALDGHISDIVYKGKHNHDPPPPNKRGKESADVNKTNNSQMETRVAELPVVDQGFNQMMRNDPVFSRLMGNDPGFNQLMRNDYGFNQMERNDQGFNQLRTNDQGSNPLTRNDQGSNQLTRNDQGSNQLIRIDEPNDEPNPKRRNTEAGPVTVPADRSTSAQKVVSEPKIVVQTRSEVDLLDDGFKWRKYGQKVVKGNTNPRSYYKCTFPGCNVRKHVERAPLDPKSVVTTYEGKHNHDIPVSRHRGYNNNNGSGGTAAKRKEPKLGNNERPVLLQMKEEEITA